MLKRLINIITLFLLLLLALSCAKQEEEKSIPIGPDAPDVVVNATVSKVEATIGDVLDFTIVLSAKPGISVAMPELAKDIDGLKIIDRGAEEAKELDDRIMTRAWYKLQTETVGSIIIPKLKVSYVDSAAEVNELATDDIYITVKSSIAEGEQVEDIIDIKPLVNVSAGLSREMLIALIAAGVILLLIVVAVIYYKKKRREEHLLIIPPHEIAFKELDALKATGLLADGEVKQFHFRLSEIFRKYLEQRYSFSASEWTTEEILPHVKWGLMLDSVLNDMVTSVLKKTDLVKFTDHLPEEKVSSLELSRAYKFVEQTIEKEEDV